MGPLFPAQQHLSGEFAPCVDLTVGLVLTVVATQIFIFSNEEYFGSDFNAQIDWTDDQLVEVRISKKNTYTTDDARQLSIGQRKCIFRDEVKLNYFPDSYTFSSCMKQCRMTKAIKLCKCNPSFYKPISKSYRR